MDIENIKKAVKESIVQNFMESTKTVRMTDGPGKDSQRPKSWSKGIKSGSHKRKMREQGKRDAQQINEEGHDEERDAVAMGYGSAAAARRDNGVILQNRLNEHKKSQDNKIKKQKQNADLGLQQTFFHFYKSTAWKNLQRKQIQTECQHTRSHIQTQPHFIKILLRHTQQVYKTIKKIITEKLVELASTETQSPMHNKEWI